MTAAVERDLAAVERAAGLLGPAATRSVPLGALTTYRVGGTAALAVAPTGEDELRRVADAVQESGVAVLVVGRGSNLLVADAGFPGLAVMVREAFDAVDVDGTLVRAGGGTSLPVLARRTAAASLAGLEWAAGIPGSVGGGVRMNAGGHGSDTAAVLERARVVGLASGLVGWRTAADLRLGYRSSDLTAADVVVAAELRCRPGDRAVSEALIDDIVRWRRVNQPGGQNAGSVFTNPDGDSAGRLIDQVGMKGFRVGTASVSTKHANFIQADEHGSADDVLAVVHAVRAAVRERTGVDLRTEVRLIGFAGTYPHAVGEGDRNG
ncbi:MAG TPA: UDP-N-acetylmuramate dehydrogenase [Acidimicrobiia bacterium]|nr:UDP-N-acetylmuramate dehydrogenase [Acidimicrobiia bacterium]